jgi:hypothetical protein
MTQAISTASATTFAGELAVLLIETDANRAESDRLQRDSARASFLENAQNQVDALHAAADATATGALVSAAFTIGSGAFAIGAANSQYDADMAKAAGASSCTAANQFDANLLTVYAKTYEALGTAGKAIVGDSVALDCQAEAKRYETLGAQAQWQASDAGSDLDKTDKRSDKVLDILQGIQRDQHTANNAIIGRI